jgi:predicted restriction endonuclease
MADQNWKEFTQKLVVDYCSERGSRTFTLEQFNAANEEKILNHSAANKHPFDKIRQQFQVLRDSGVLTFVSRGNYTLRQPIVLYGELQEDAPAFVYDFVPRQDRERCEKREYAIETFARDRGWVKQAKDVHGYNCLHPACQNTFKKPDGVPYIEVHHIIPLFENGEDTLANLAVVCAHHHKMAHFAEGTVQTKLKDLFLGIVDERLSAGGYQ